MSRHVDPEYDTFDGSASDLDVSGDEGPIRKRQKGNEAETPWPCTSDDQLLEDYPHIKFQKGTTERSRYERIKWAEVVSGYVFDSEVLQEVGLLERALFFMGGLDTPWSRLYDQDLPAYREMSVEFLCTFKYHYVFPFTLTL